MKYLKEISLVANAIFLIIILALSIEIAELHCSLAKQDYEQEKLIKEKDKIIEDQHYYILALTYQHEDDDALAEEEQP